MQERTFHKIFKWYGISAGTAPLVEIYFHNWSICAFAVAAFVMVGIVGYVGIVKKDWYREKIVQ